jgi:hypothetical protein
VFLAARNIVSIYRKLFNGALSACDEVERSRVHVTGFTPETHKNGREKEREKDGKVSR